MDLNKFKINNKFLMLALDHRGHMRKLLNPENPDAATSEQIISVKSEIIKSIEDQFSGVLVDQDFGLEAFQSTNSNKPFLLPVEESGYETVGEDRLTKIKYSATDLIKLGASAAKLLIFFNPQGKSALKQIETCQKVLNDCRQNHFPLFLEIRIYQGDREADKMDEGEREDLNIESIKMFLQSNIKPDVYKLEYPGTALACQKVTTILGDIPWILLTMGASFEEFKEELKQASIRGCQGFLAGRALWQEVCSISGDEKQKFLSETMPERFREIAKIATSP